MAADFGREVFLALMRPEVAKETLSGQARDARHVGNWRSGFLHRDLARKMTRRMLLAGAALGREQLQELLADAAPDAPVETLVAQRLAGVRSMEFSVNRCVFL